MPTTVNYQAVRGLPWSRCITVKSNRTHYRVNVTDPVAFIKITDNQKKQIAAEINSQGIIELVLDSSETTDLPVGALPYDVWANVQVGLGEIIYQPVAKGMIDVSTYGSISPLEEVDGMELRFKQHTDFRRTFTLADDAGVTLVVQNAFMQAKSTAGVTVLDLRWYSSAPSENTVIALSPNNTRGYIAPIAGGTLEVHISNKNSIPAGSHSFDLFVQDSIGDWDCLVSGTIVVEAAVSVPPV